MSDHSIASFPARHWRSTLLVAGFIALIAVLLILRMSPDSSVQNMLPRGNESAAAMGHVLNDFAAADQLLVLVTHSENNATIDQPRLLGFAASLAAAVEKTGIADAVVYQADEQSKDFFIQKLAPASIYYLSDQRYQQAKARLKRDEMARQIHQDEALMSAPGPAAGGLASAFMQDPLRLHEFLVDEMKSRKPGGILGNSGGFFSPDGRSLLIRIIGKKSIDDLEYDNRLTNTVQQVCDRLPHDQLTIEISGGYAIAATSQQKIKHDMIVSVVSSVLLLQGLFIVAYRKPIRYFLLAFVPVALGLLYGFGVRALLSSVISPAAAVVGAVLAGMGIDYTVLYLPHYHTARADGLSPVDAVGSTTRKLLSPLSAACITSVIGFAAIGWSSVPALRDFSLVGSLGLVGAMICAVVILPVLLAMQDRGQTGSARPRFNLEPLLNRVTAWRKVVFAGWAIVLIAAIAVIAIEGGPMLPMESDLTVMHPRPNPALDAEAGIAKRMGTDPGAMAVYLTAQTPDQLIELAYDVEQRLQQAGVRQTGVVGVFGLSTLLPDPRVVVARQAESTAARADQVVNDFKAVIADSSFDESHFTGYETFLRSMLSNPPVPTLADLGKDRRVSENFLSRDELQGTATAKPEAMTLIFFDHPLDSRAQRQAAVTAIRQALSGLDGATLTGLGVISLDTESTIQRDLPKLLIAALGLNVLYLLIHFRSLRSAMLAMIPTAVSLLLLAAFAKMTGQKLNLVNLVSLPLLIGIDVDYGIYLVSLARPRTPITASQARRRVATSGYSVMISAAANVLGFGSLMTTSVPAIQSLGWAVGIGVAACFAGTIFLLAPMLMAGDARGGPRPSGTGYESQ
jgi:predicted RND superfamily exporter protein